MKRLGFLFALFALLFAVPASAAGLVAHIDISSQTMQVSINGATRYVWPVSTARVGYAIHGTYEVGHLGRPASHGCVRLNTGNAATRFSLVSQYGYGNTAIII